MGRPKKSCNKQGHKAGGARPGCGRKSATFYRERHEEHIKKINELETQVAELLKKQQQYEKEHPSTTQQQTQVTEPAAEGEDDSEDETSSDDDDEEQQQPQEETNNPLHLMKTFHLTGSKSYMPPVGSPIGDYLTNIKKQMIQKSPQEIKSMSMWIPPPSSASASASDNSNLLEHVWIYIWLIKEQFDITTNPCIHCVSLQTESEGLAFRPMIWWDNIVWVLHRRYRCRNPKCHYTGTRGTRCSFSTMDYQYLKQLPFDISQKFDFISKPSGMGIHKSMLQVLSNFNLKEQYKGDTFVKVIQQCHHDHLEEKKAAYQIVRKKKTKSLKKRRREESNTTLTDGAPMNDRASSSSQQQQETQQQDMDDDDNNNNNNSADDEREVLPLEEVKRQQATTTPLSDSQDLPERNSDATSTTTDHVNQNIATTAIATTTAQQPPASSTTTLKRQTRSSSKQSRTVAAVAVCRKDESPAPDSMNRTKVVLGGSPPPSSRSKQIGTFTPTPPTQAQAPLPAPPPPPQQPVQTTTTLPFTTTTTTTATTPQQPIRYTYSYRKQPKYQRRNKPRKCANYPLCNMDASECGGYISASCRNPSIIGTDVANEASTYACHDVRHPQLPTKDEVLKAREQQKQHSLRSRRCAWYPICTSFTNECGGHTRDKCGLYGTDGIHAPPSMEEFEKARKRDLANRRAESRRKQKENEERLQQRWKTKTTSAYL